MLRVVFVRHRLTRTRRIDRDFYNIQKLLIMKIVCIKSDERYLILLSLRVAKLVFFFDKVKCLGKVFYFGSLITRVDKVINNIAINLVEVLK